MKTSTQSGWVHGRMPFPASVCPLPTQFSGRSIVECSSTTESTNTRARLTVHANWDILFKLHCAFPSKSTAGKLRAGYCAENICPWYPMWPDNPGFPIPSVLVEGISLRESHRCLGSRSSWKTDPYVARNPVDLKELGFGIHSAPFQSLCMANSLWPGNIRENVALVRRPARIKIENKRRCYDFLHAGYLQNSGPWM